MGKFLPVFLLALIAIAIFLEGDYVLTLVYLFFGALIASRWWGGKVMRSIDLERSFNHWAFLGEKVRVDLNIKNRSFLPVPWLQIRESLPVGLHSRGPFQDVVYLTPKGNLDFSYQLDCKKRGLYPVGPLHLFSGDVLGVGKNRTHSLAPEYLTVYPKIIPLVKIDFPSQSPMGTLRHNQPIFEDPTRVRGKRDYTAGDSLRRIDWKATATSGRLQVKQFEPSISLETMIFLNLNANEYDFRTRFFDSELAITVAASMANWIVSARQSVGLATNGYDPLMDASFPPILPARRGRGHLLRLLEILARLQMVESLPLSQLLHQELAKLPWGATLILVSGKIDDDLFDSLFQARRAGMNAYLVQCGQTKDIRSLEQKARQFGIPLVNFMREEDLDIWRR
jgi:uncharacterized protein (DUF58 family)